MVRFAQRILVLIGLALAFAIGPAAAQDNFDAGKKPAQLFASDCGGCHKSPAGLSKAPSLFGLESFLREHYTASRQSAAMIAGYLQAIDAEQAAKQAARQRKGEPQQKADRPVKRQQSKPESKAADSKATPEKKADAKPDAKPDANADTKSHTGSVSGQPAEPKAAEATPAESKPADAKPTEPVGPASGKSD